MKKYPFVKQEGAKDCGVASVLMIIKYYNGYISLKELEEMTHTTNTGTTFYHLVNALKEIGFSAEGISCNIKNLSNRIPMPCIASVLINNTYKHFVVIYEVTSQYLVIADPSLGIKKMSFSEFQKIYQGVLIVMEPKRTIPYLGEQKYYTWLEILKENKKIIQIVVLYSILTTILSICSSFYFGKLVGYINSLKNMLTIIFFIFFSINFVKIIMDYIRRKIFLILSKQLDLKITLEVFSKILSLPYKHYKNHTTGDIMTRLNDLSNIKDLVQKLIICIFIDIPFVTLSMVLLGFLNFKLFLISLFILTLNILLILILKKIIYFSLLNLKKLTSSKNSHMLDAINSYETINGINLKEHLERKVTKSYINYLNGHYKLTKIILIKQLIKDFINNLGLVIIDYIGILLVYDFKLSLSTLLTFNTILNYFISSVNSLIDFTIDYNEYSLSLKRINQIMIPTKEIGFINRFSNGDIVFHNLTYSFDDITDILTSVNLKIRENEKLVVIGKSGSGKSTLFKLLKRYYNFDFDRITINNVDINNYQKQVLDNNILYVNQNELIYTDTILNNIKLDGKIDSKFLKICEICLIDDIIKKTKFGFKLFLEENGFNLSGGERQRIILARTLLRDFKILVIDEALNQVDVRMERQILKNIFKFFNKKTIIFISHRLNNCDLFDHIIEMRKGSIIRDEIRTL